MTATDLDLDGPWRIGEDAFAAVVEQVEAVAAEHVVEFGGGASSIRLARALPHATILSIEHDPVYFEAAEAMRRAHAPEARLDLSLRPLRWQTHYLGRYQSYAPGPFPARVDAVIIDGPPYTTFRGREACLYQVMGRLRVGGVVILDDYRRPAEARMARNWDRIYPGQFRTQVLPVGNHLCVKHRIAPGEGRPALGVLADNYPHLLRRWVRGGLVAR